MTDLTVIIIIVSSVVVTAVTTSLLTSRKMRRKVSYMLDALEDNELNFRFDENRRIGRRFNRNLNRLRGLYDREMQEIARQEKFYGLMLDHVKTGVVVIDESGSINYCNTTALDLLGLATFGHIRHLRSISDHLYNAFRTVDDSAEERVSYYNEKGKMTVSLTASKATIENKNVKVVAFNDISSEMAENEQESWTRLIRVLTHEIMNTVTPIASLCETMLNFENTDAQVRSGLDTISQSSRGLIKFVESYRNLTRVATPVKRAFYVRDVVERVMNLTSDQVTEAGTECIYTEKSDDIIIYADEGQITQILINLIRNAVQANARKIEITAEINLSEHVIINVSNDGSPISKESYEEIFVPFYTTKPDGTGIGLSLSRQIMRLHNGSLSLTRSDETGTVFTLVFR